MQQPGDPVLGYACSWWTPREATWSYISDRLRSGLAAQRHIVDIETQSPPPVRLAQLAAARLTGRPWQYTRFSRAFVDHRARAGVARLHPDAVLAVADVDTPLPVPTVLYQDMSLALGIAQARTGHGEHVNIVRMSPRRLDELERRSIERLRRADGICTMSRWLADHLVDCGVAAERVRVVHAGVTSLPTERRDPDEPAAGRLLFVGVDFVRKGGDAVVDAVRTLRADGRDVRLTVVGPPAWPLAGAPPDWVDFRGQLAPAEVSRLWSRHDAFVMPSRFEAYGIVFVEALAAGLPCVAHRAFAMPELVDDTVTGRLVDAVDGEQVAAAVADVLDDPGYFSRVATARADIVERYDWRTVARRTLGFIDELTA